MNLGKSDARASREGLVSELARWVGPIAVIDGDFSHELPFYPVLNEALLGAISRNAGSGFQTRRIDGDAASDFDQAAAAKKLVVDFQLSPADHAIKLTGAWLEEVHEDGCVDDVFNTLTEAGFSVDVLDSAFTLAE